MTFTKGLITSFICLALSSGSLAMSRPEEGRSGARRDHNDYRPAAYHQNGDHDRDEHHPAGWEKGKKKGWEGRRVPPGQANKHHAQYRRAHHHRAHHPATRKPMATKPMTQADRNRAFGQNVQARKAEVEQQRAAEKH